MQTVTFQIPDDYKFETKINRGTRQDPDWKPVVYEPGKMHESWLLAFLEKGMQRYANDKYSQDSGDTKLDLCRAVAKMANSGDEMPEKERGSRKASVPDDVALAIRNAKADLTLTFKRLTGVGKIADMVEADERVQKYFEAKGDAWVWRDEVVQDWIGKQKEAGKRDYIQEAKDALAVDVEEIDI
jgi:hypothetical protein